MAMCTSIKQFITGSYHSLERPRTRKPLFIGKSLARQGHDAVSMHKISEVDECAFPAVRVRAFPS